MAFPEWESEVVRSGRMSRSLDEAFGILSGRRTPSTRIPWATRHLEVVPIGRFQIYT